MKNDDRLRREERALLRQVLYKRLVPIKTIFPICYFNIHREKRA